MGKVVLFLSALITCMVPIHPASTATHVGSRTRKLADLKANEPVYKSREETTHSGSSPQLQRFEVTGTLQAQLHLLLGNDLCDCLCAFAHEVYAYTWKSQMCKILQSIFNLFISNC